MAKDKELTKEEGKRWQARRAYFDVAAHEPQLTAIFEAVRAGKPLSPKELFRILRLHPPQGGGIFSKQQLVQGYRELCAAGRFPFERETLSHLQMKPIRTISGVAPVAVMTKPYACPGRCIFCPTDVRMPKSYLHDEPGAMRAEQNDFDPYRQVASRIAAYEAIGHSTDKIELLVLGGTWSAYPASYQDWFVQRCLDAMNGCDSDSLEEAQRINEKVPHRNVGLVLETRPDWVTPDEVRRLRHLGATKVQLGAQSLDDRVLALNRRGHDVEATRRAVRLLRLAGFKLHLHWMPNLLGATPELDRADFRRLWDDPALRPDELKIYPTALLRNAELYEWWERGEYEPYERDDLVALIADCKQTVPPYCRLNRIIRDIPSGNIVAGNKTTNLREVVQKEMERRGQRCRCIRCREVRKDNVQIETLRLDEVRYDAGATEERFLSFVTPEDRIAGFLRLSLPRDRQASGHLFPELEGCAMIREVHIYGPALALSSESEGEAQHLGLGRRLIERAEQIVREEGYGRLAVISAIGTRGYYRRHGFEMDGLYMVKSLV